MKKFVALLTIILLSFLAFFTWKGQQDIISPVGKQVAKIIEKPLEKYTFEALKETLIAPSQITLGRVLKEEDDFTSRMFYIDVDTLSKKMGKKKVSGLINIPTRPGSYPVIVMFRGYVPKENFTTGEGTRRSAEILASNGFITLAPDFLGFGESDPYSEDQMEARFQTYPTALTMLSSVANLNAGLEAHSTGSGQVKADPEKIGIWGHSNGGHITLSALAISGKEYPTVLWNPVSKPFPYSVFFFMDEDEDNGKKLRHDMAAFEEDYDIEKYSPPNYYQWIAAPIQLHQGGEDIAVPQRWSDQLTKKLKDLDKDITYFIYPGEDHNFLQGSYNLVIQRTINFYQQKLR